MILPILMAFTAGVLVAVSRQVNGRLSLSTSALVSSFWNHVVGFVVLCAIGRHALVRVERQPGCTACGRCDEVCTTGAICRGQIDPMACTMCLACVDHCPQGALAVHSLAPARASEGAEGA